MGRLQDKVTLITGAASGIGRAGAEAFAAEGAVVGVLDRNRAAVAEVCERLGERGVPLVGDVTDESSVREAFAALDAQYGRLDALYNCAAVQLHGEDHPAHEVELSVWLRTIEINLTGVFLCCKHGIGLMLKHGKGGSVINCSSPTAITGCGAGFTAYSASKGGVLSLTRVLAIDYAKHGIRVNNIVPGTTMTAMTEPMFRNSGTLSDYTAGTPLGRLAGPDDYCGVAVYLASDESSFATGADFVVDGGLTIR